MEGDDEHQDSDGKEYDIPSKGKFRNMERADKGNGANDYGYNCFRYYVSSMDRIAMEHVEVVSELKCITY